MNQEILTNCSLSLQGERAGDRGSLTEVKKLEIQTTQIMQDQPNYHENLFKGATKTTFENARNNRKTATETEKLMWEELRGKKINGYKFRRQHPIDTFIADFYCHEKKIVVEIDGEYHFQNDQPQYDTWRTEVLENLGITVIRFSNYEVEYEIEKVINLLKEILKN